MKIKKKTIALIAAPFVIAGITVPIVLTTVVLKKDTDPEVLTNQERQLLNAKSSFSVLQGKIKADDKIDPLHELHAFEVDAFQQTFGFPSFPTLPDGYDVKYTHNGINVDGTLIVYVHLIPQTNGTEVIVQLPVIVEGIDMALATRAVQSLKQSNFNQLKTVLPSQVTPSQVATVIKQLIATAPARNLITPDHITLQMQDDEQGKMIITIDSYGPQITIAVDHFLTRQDVHNRLVAEAVADFSQQTPTMMSDVALIPLDVEQTLSVEQAKIFGLDVSNIDQSLHLEYMHNGIYADGPLILTIVIADEAKTLQKFVNVNLNVTGINAGDAERAVQQLTISNFDLLKQQLPSQITTTDVAGVIRGLITNPAASALVLPEHVTLKDVNDEQGSLTIIVTSHGADVTFNLTDFLNLEIIANQKINDAIAILEPQNPSIALTTTLEPLSQELPLDAIAAQTFGIDISGIDQTLSLQYTHNGIDADGVLTLTVIINDPTSSMRRALNLDIDVSGINQAVASATVQGLNNSHFDSLKDHLPSQVTEAKISETIITLIPHQAARNLITNNNITLSNLDDDAGTMSVTISGHGSDVVLALDNFKTNQNVIDQAIEDAVTILTTQDRNVQLDAALEAPDQEIEFDQAAASQFGISLVGIDPNLQLKYTHEAIFIDGDWTISVVITSADGTTTRVANIGIKVTGINQGDATRAVQSLQPSNFDALKDTLPSVVTNQAILETIQGLIFNTNAHPLIKLDQITLKDVDDQNGSLTVVISDHGATKTVTITGFITTIIQETNHIEAALANLEAQSPTVNFDDILAPLHQELLLDQATANLFGINLTGIDPTLTLQYTHNGISANGILPISIVITSPSGISQVAQVDVNVKGIDEALARQAVQTLGENNFDALKEKLPSVVTRTDVLAIIQSRIASQAARELVQLNDITLSDLDDHAGALSLTITGHGQDVNLLISEFRTSIDVEKDHLDQAVALLGAQNPTIVRTSAIALQQDPQLLTSVIADWFGISLAGVDSELTLVYNHNGLVVNGELVFNVGITTTSGYEKTLSININVTGIDENDASVAVHSLANANFDHLKSDMPSAVKITDVIPIVRALIANSQARDLITADDIDLQNVNDTSGTMTIVINNHGPQKVIAVTGFFSHDIQAARLKHNEIINAVNESHINSHLRWYNQVDRREIASNYQIEPPFTRTIDGVVVTFIIEATRFDDPAGILYWKVTISSLHGVNRELHGQLSGFTTRNSFYFTDGAGNEQRVQDLVFIYYDSRQELLSNYHFRLENDYGYHDNLSLAALRDLTIIAPNPANARFLTVTYNTIDPLQKLNMNLTLNFFDGKKILEIKFKIASTRKAVIDYGPASFVPINYF